MLTKKEVNELSYVTIGCAIEVHKELGPGLLENIYQSCFLEELSLKGLSYKSELKVPVFYKGKQLDSELRLDVLVANCLIVEIKAVEKILDVHHAQLLTYMKLLEKPKGIILNFNCSNLFKEGQRTLVNNLYSSLADF